MLKNTVALVAGGAGSLGLATVKKLIEEGSKVLVFDVPDASNTVRKHLGTDVLFLGGDVTSEDDVKNAMSKVKLEFGRLNVLVNCAGISSANLIYNFNKNTCANLDDLLNLLKVNIGGTLNTNRLGASLMSENSVDEDGLRGLIINTSGFYAFDGQIGQVGMSAVAGAITSMTLPMCRDLSHVGIRVMTIAPGVMNSNLTDFIPKKVCRHIGLVTPNPKRLGMPEEYAHLVQTIIQNKFLNGETIRLDGGLRMYLQT